MGVLVNIGGYTYTLPSDGDPPQEQANTDTTELPAPIIRPCSKCGVEHELEELTLIVDQYRRRLICRKCK